MLYVVVTGCMFRFHAGWEECVCHDSDVMLMKFLTGVQLDRVYIRIVILWHKLSPVGVTQSDVISPLC